MFPRALGLICQHGLRGPGQSWRRGTLVHVRVGPALAVRVAVGVALPVCLVVTVDPAVTAQVRRAVRQAAVGELQVVLRGVVQLGGGGGAWLSQDPSPGPLPPPLPTIPPPPRISDQTPDPGHRPSASRPGPLQTLPSGQTLTVDKPQPLPQVPGPRPSRWAGSAARG